MIIANQISDQEIETLLEEILDYYGYDFTEYARASIKRRILRIFTLEKFETFLQLRNKVINDRKFFKRFVEEITVNVTEMFRDPKFYKCLRSDILPKLQHILLYESGLQVALQVKKPIPLQSYSKN